jgi:hypothetical protein
MIVTVVLIPILIVVLVLLLHSVFLHTFLRVIEHTVLLHHLKPPVWLLVVGQCVVVLVDLVEMHRVQNPAFE